MYIAFQGGMYADVLSLLEVLWINNLIKKSALRFEYDTNYWIYQLLYSPAMNITVNMSLSTIPESHNASRNRLWPAERKQSKTWNRCVLLCVWRSSRWASAMTSSCRVRNEDIYTRNFTAVSIWIVHHFSLHVYIIIYVLNSRLLR